MPCSAPLGVDQAGEESVDSAATAAAESAGAEAGHHAARGHRGLAVGDQGEAGSQEEAATKQRMEQARLLLSAAAAFGLEGCWQWKPLMDGKQVSTRESVAWARSWQLDAEGGRAGACKEGKGLPGCLALRSVGMMDDNLLMTTVPLPPDVCPASHRSWRCWA